MENFWPSCLERLELALSAQQFNTWIKPLQVEIDGNIVRLVAPNRFVMQWVKDRFSKKIEQYAQESHLDDVQIVFSVANLPLEQPTKAPLLNSHAQTKPVGPLETIQELLLSLIHI